MCLEEGQGTAREGDMTVCNDYGAVLRFAEGMRARPANESDYALCTPDQLLMLKACSAFLTSRRDRRQATERARLN
jgi:squalene cyclase